MKLMLDSKNADFSIEAVMNELEQEEFKKEVAKNMAMREQRARDIGLLSDINNVADLLNPDNEAVKNIPKKSQKVQPIELSVTEDSPSEPFKATLNADSAIIEAEVAVEDIKASNSVSQRDLLKKIMLDRPPRFQFKLTQKNNVFINEYLTELNNESKETIKRNDLLNLIIENFFKDK